MTAREAHVGCVLILAHTALMLAAMHSGSSSEWLAAGQAAATVAVLAGVWHLMVARSSRRRLKGSP